MHRWFERGRKCTTAHSADVPATATVILMTALLKILGIHTCIAKAAGARMSRTKTFTTKVSEPPTALVQPATPGEIGGHRLSMASDRSGGRMPTGEDDAGCSRATGRMRRLAVDFDLKTGSPLEAVNTPAGCLLLVSWLWFK